MALGKILGAITSPVASIAGSLIGGVLGNKGRKDESARNRDFQEEMSSTSYQRAVADMQAAGLNPMLAYSQGGASTPSGSQAQIEDVITPSINTGIRAREAIATVRNLEETNRKIRAETNEAAAREALARATIPKMMADVQQSYSSAYLMQSQTDMTRQLAAQAVAKTSHIRSDEARVRAMTSQIMEQTKNIPLTAEQIQAATQLAVVQARAIATGTRLDELRIPGAESDAWSRGTWFGKYVTPWLPSLLQGSNSAAAVGRGIRSMR